MLLTMTGRLVVYVTESFMRHVLRHSVLLTMMVVLRAQTACMAVGHVKLKGHCSICDYLVNDYCSGVSFTCINSVQ